MKKPLGTKADSGPPKLTFFLDNCFGKHLVEAMRTAGHQIVHHLERFASDEKDEVWLPQVGKERWIVLSKDKKIRIHGIEATALMNAEIRAFLLVSENLDGASIERVVLGAMSRIQGLLLAHKKPFIAVIHRDSTVHVRLKYKDWKRRARDKKGE